MSNVEGEEDQGQSRVSPLWLWLLIILAAYLVFRVVQGVLWVVHRL